MRSRHAGDSAQGAILLGRNVRGRADRLLHGSPSGITRGGSSVAGHNGYVGAGTHPNPAALASLLLLATLEIIPQPARGTKEAGSSHCSEKEIPPGEGSRLCVR